MLLALSLALGAALLPARGGAACARPRSGRIVCQQPVYLTREQGKNTKLEKLLAERGIPSAELPCIAFQQLKGAEELPALLAAGGISWVVVTSPESATVFAAAWESAGRPQVRVASVGSATAKSLSSFGITTSFTPSKATGKVLAAELPRDGGRPSVLYPCSALAADTVADALTERGFNVERLETYTTVPADWTPEQEAMARSAAVVSFGSPSAVRVWHERVGAGAIAACIGETSAKQAQELGFERVVAPASPGVEAWAETIADLGIWGEAPVA